MKKKARIVHTGVCLSVNHIPFGRSMMLKKIPVDPFLTARVNDNIYPYCAVYKARVNGDIQTYFVVHEAGVNGDIQPYCPVQ